MPLMFCGCLNSFGQTISKPLSQEPMTTKKYFDKWQGTQFTVYSASNGAMQVATGIATIVRRPTEPEKHGLPFQVFMTDRTHAVWAGAPQHIYIEEERAILGVKFIPYSGILLVPSLNVGINATDTDMSSMAKKTEAAIDYKNAFGHSVGKSGYDAKFLEGTTFVGLRGVFGAVLFRNDSSAVTPSEIQNITAFAIDNGILKMDIARAEGRSTGSVWIRIKERTLLRAEENGVQVFPAAAK